MEPNPNIPTSIGDILGGLKDTTELGRNLHEARVWEHWPDIVGTKLMHHSQPIRVRDGILTIAVENSVWMHRISYKKQEIIGEIANLLGPDFVNDLFFALVDQEPREK